MDRLHEMQVFVAVADEQGFASAARRLNLSAPAVTRAIAALEERLGARLLARSTRGVRVTEAGGRFLEGARHLLAEVEASEESAAGAHVVPRGHLTVSAPVLFGQHFLLPLMLDFLDLHAEVTAQTMFVDRAPNLHEEGVDVGILSDELPDSSLVAQRIGEIRRVVCAAPSYVARCGAPQTPADLAGHTLVMSSADACTPDWRFYSEGEVQPLHLSPRLVVSSNQAAIDCAVAGFGITRAMSYQVQPQLLSGALQVLLDAFEPAPVPMHLVCREGRRASAKVRGFVDFAVERLRTELARE